MTRVISFVLVGLLVVALTEALPNRNQNSDSHSRQKRGFRINSADRVAHGYGKRQFDTWSDDSSLKTDSPRELLTVRELAELAAGNPTLIEALLQKFVDTNDDGMVSSQELFGTPLQ